MIDRVLDQRRRFVDVEFAADAQAMGFDRAHADVQFAGHFLVVQPLSHFVQHLAFARRQLVVRAFIGDQPLRDFGAVERAAAGNGFDGRNDFPRR